MEFDFDLQKFSLNEWEQEGMWMFAHQLPINPAYAKTKITAETLSDMLLLDDRPKTL